MENNPRNPKTLAMRPLRFFLYEALIFCFYLLLTVLLTWPWSLHLGDAIADNGDSYAFVWSLWWNYYQTIHDPLNLFHANIFFPYRYTLAFTEHGYGVAMLFFPLLAIGIRPLTVYSVAILCAFAFCGYASFRLARTLTGSLRIAFVAGIIFAFIPYRFLFITALPYLFCGWLPLSLEALILFTRKRSWRRAIWFGVSILMSGMTNVTWFFYSLIPLGVSFVFLVIRYDIAKDRYLWERGLTATVISATLLFPFLWPYYKASTLYMFRKESVEVSDNAVRTVEWLTAPRYNKLWGSMGSGLQGARVTLFTGLLPLLLFLGGVLSVNGQETMPTNTNKTHSSSLKKCSYVLAALDGLCIVALILAILAAGYSHAPDLSRFAGRFLNTQTSDRALFVLSILLFVRVCLRYPEILQVGRGQNFVQTLRSERRGDAFWIGGIWALFGFVLALGMNTFFYRVLYDFLLPFQSLRAPHRAAMISYVGFAALAGVGAARVMSLNFLRGPIRSKAALSAIALILLIELNASPLPFIHGAVDPDDVTLKLKETPMRGAVIDLPSLPQPPYYSWHLSMLRSTDHEHPVIFAASSFIPPITMQVHQLATESTLRPELLTLLEEIQTSYIVFHRKLAQPDQEAEFARFFSEGVASGRLRFVGTFAETDDLYAVVKTEPESR